MAELNAIQHQRLVAIQGLSEDYVDPLEVMCDEKPEADECR